MRIMNLSVEVVSWPQAASRLRAIRTEVFVLEQQVPAALEWDGLDEEAMHVLAHAGGEAVGTARLLIEGATGRVGRMAVRKAWRKRGVGGAMLVRLIELARARNCREVYLHAQTHALDFYARHGFVAEGALFMEAEIAHRGMRLLLRPSKPRDA
jgi:predicted GNAT family N-acyltransferase